MWCFMRASVRDVLSNVSKVAVVGATPKEGKVGNVLLRNIITYGFKGKVYPVNPKYDEIMGMKVYRSVKEIPDTIDVVLVATPAPTVPQILNDSINKGARLGVVISSGFKEAGNVEAQKELEKIAAEGRVRILGPNSAGITISRIGLHASIEVLPDKGMVGLAMQSGAMGGIVISRLRWLSSGVSFFLSIGNAADVGVEDAFEYALEDPETEAMVAYVEWVKNGRRFIEAGRRLNLKKPLCILKGGRGSVSLRAVASHTGGLAGDYEVFKAAVRKTGGYLADDVDDLVEVCEVLRRIKGVKGGRILIVSNSGGLSIVTASQLEEAAVSLPLLTEAVKERMWRAAGKKFSGSNPVDFGGDSFMDQVVKAFTVDGLEKMFDLGVLVYVPTAAEKPEGMARAILDTSSEFKIPVIGYFDGEGAREVVKAVSSHIPCVTTSGNVSKAVKALQERTFFLSSN